MRRCAIRLTELQFAHSTSGRRTTRRVAPFLLTVTPFLLTITPFTADDHTLYC